MRQTTLGTISKDLWFITLNDERDGAARYEGMAAIETNVARAERFRELARVERREGLLPKLPLLLGVAGTGASPRTLLLTSLADLLTGASSMAGGEYI